MTRIHKQTGPPGRAAPPVPFKDGDLWRVDFRAGGKNGIRYRRAFPTSGEAQGFIDRALSGDEKPVKATLPGLIDEYIRWSEKIKGKAPDTVRGDRIRLKVFETWAGGAGVKRPADVDFKAMANFQSYFHENYPFDKGRIHKRYKALNPKSTWEKYRQIVSAFYVWCMKRGHAKLNPASDPELKNEIQRIIPNPLQPQELTAILEHFTDRETNQPVPVMSIFVRLMVYTGMRLGEALALTWADIDQGEQLIKIARSKNKGVRTIPINPRLRPWLERLPRIGPLVLDNGRGKPLYTDSWYRKEMVTAYKDTGVPRRRIHDLRHTFAVTMVLAGVSLAIVQRLLGHESIQTTMQYLVFAPSDLRAGTDVLNF